MKKLSIVIIGLLLIQSSYSQKRYFTKTGVVSFEDTSPNSLDEVNATNKSATSVFDATTGVIQFSMLIKGFEFKSSLMQEHFNENYLESDKYEKSVFSGKIKNLDKINFQKDGLYPVIVTGSLEIHGVKKDVEATGTFKVTGESVTGTANFDVALEDYKITIPGLVKDKIAKIAKIKVSCNYAILKTN